MRRLLRPTIVSAYFSFESVQNDSRDRPFAAGKLHGPRILKENRIYRLTEVLSMHDTVRRANLLETVVSLAADVTRGSYVCREVDNFLVEARPPWCS